MASLTEEVAFSGDLKDAEVRKSIADKGKDMYKILL